MHSPYSLYNTMEPAYARLEIVNSILTSAGMDVQANLKAWEKLTRIELHALRELTFGWRSEWLA